MDFFIGILVISITAGIHWYQKEPAVLPDPLHQKQQHQLYTGLLGVALFVLLLSVAIIYFWQPYQVTTI